MDVKSKGPRVGPQMVGTPAAKKTPTHKNSKAGASAQDSLASATEGPSSHSSGQAKQPLDAAFQKPINHEAPSSRARLTPQQSYIKNREVLRDIVANDHFGGEMPDAIVDQWVKALEPGSKMPLPPHLKGFYGGDLKASIPIEVARGAYKYIAHEPIEAHTRAHYAQRMLTALSVLDVDALAKKDPNVGAIALWHMALAQVRLPNTPENAKELGETLAKYDALRPKSDLSDSKLPQPGRLKARLRGVAQEIGNEKACDWLDNWKPAEDATT